MAVTIRVGRKDTYSQPQDEWASCLSISASDVRLREWELADYSATGAL